MKIVFLTSMFLVCYVPILFYFGFIPYLTRKTTVFGVSIPEEIFDATEVVELRKRFTKIALGFGIPIGLIALILALLGNEIVGISSFTAGIFIEMGIFFWTYLKFHKEMKVLKEKNDWTKNKTQVVVVDTGFKTKRLMVSPMWFLIHIIVIAATAIAGYFFYDVMPDRIPMKYNFSGEVTVWANKSYRLLLFAPIMQVFMTVIMGFVYWTIGKAKQQVEANSPEVSIEQNRVFRYRWSMFTVLSSILLLIMFGYMQFAFIFSTNVMLNTLIPMICTGAIVIGSIILSLTTGQGGSRVRTIQDVKGKEINRDDDRFWKLGMFYYNPDDPAVFLEKRFGIGWTNNWARPASWAMIVGLIIFVVAMTIVSSYLTK